MLGTCTAIFIQLTVAGASYPTAHVDACKIVYTRDVSDKSWYDMKCYVGTTDGGRWAFEVKDTCTEVRQKIKEALDTARTLYGTIHDTAPKENTK